ncbi:MAG TPA: DUF488 domain-containing protein [Acidobacteriaceae bacterium]|nr:DUF488 domain-containing protein [Acidobacteriaceae bacterium]
MLTVGHSTLPIETFLGMLQKNGVGLLIDIRTVPRSRHNPQFEQGALSHALAAGSIEYRWQSSLGGLRKPKKGSLLNLGWKNESFRGYADYMQTSEFAAAIDELLRHGLEKQSVIMCAEAVPWRCHRSLVADALTAREIPVEHILYDKHGSSKRQPHRLTGFAKVSGTRIWYPAEPGLFPAPAPPDSNRG